MVTLAKMYSPRGYERELYSEALRLIDQNQVASVRMIGDQQISSVLEWNSLRFYSAYGQDV